MKNLEICVLSNMPDLTIIAGPNGAGKSTLFEALGLWKRVSENVGIPYSTFMLQRLVRVGSANAEIDITVEFTGSDIQLLTGIANSGMLGMPAVMQSSVPSRETFGLIVDASGSVLRSGSGRILPAPDRVRFPGAPGVEFFGPNRFVPPRDFQAPNPQMLSQQAEMNRRFTPPSGMQNRAEIVKDALYAEEMRNLEAMRAAREDAERRGSDVIELSALPEVFREINSWINQLLPTVSFYGIRQVPNGPSGVPSSLFLFEVSGGARVDFDELSSGEKEVIGLLVDLHRMSLQSSILIIDEPELHLNSAVEARLVPFLLERVVANGRNQVILVTHSPTIISSAPDGSVFRLSLPRSNTNQIAAVSTSEDRMDMLRDLAGDIGIYTTADRFVFLEGESGTKGIDKPVFEAYFPSLRGRLAFVPSGGSADVQGVTKKLQEVLEASIPFGKFFAIRDRDRLSAQAITRLESIPGLRVLPRTMLENYLLDPDGIAELATMVGIPRSSEEISSLMKAEAVKLLDYEVSERSESDLRDLLPTPNLRSPDEVSVITSLERLEAACVLARSKVPEIKARVSQLVRNEIDSGTFVLNFDGKRLLHKVKSALQFGLTDVQLAVGIANVQRQRGTIPSDLTAMVEQFAGSVTGMRSA